MIQGRVDRKECSGEGEMGRGTMGEGEMGRGQRGRGDRGGGGGQRRGGKEGARGGWISQMDMMKYLGGPGYRVELQVDRMPGAIEAMVFTDSHKHMECLGGMRSQSFVTLFTCATPGNPASGPQSDLQVHDLEMCHEISHEDHIYSRS